VPELLFIDTETGGLDPRRNSIISLGAVVWRNGELIDEFEVLIREPELCLDPEALAINKIDRREIELRGKTPSCAIDEFENFLKKNFSGDLSNRRLTLAGHNIGFDKSFLRRLYEFTNRSFDDTFSHRSIDTSSIVAFLMLAGAVAIDKPSSDAAFEYFGINFKPGTRHTSLGDAAATATLFNRLLEVVCAPSTK
jgi:DNA polymerase III epsilon subunit-like protein